MHRILRIITRWMAYTAVALACGGLLERQDPVANATSNPIVINPNRILGVQPGLALGVGFNTLSGETAGRCLDQVEVPSCTETGKSWRYSVKFISDTKSLKQALDVSASASFSAGVYSADAAAKFASSKHARSDSAYLYLSSEVTFDDTVSSRGLAAASIATLRADSERFVAQCGDAYVASVQKGARFRAIYEFKHVSSGSQQDLAVTLGGGGAGWSADASFKKALEESLDHYEYELFVLQDGGRFESSTMTPTELIAKAQAFPTQVSCANATTISALTKSYYTAPGFPDGLRLPDLTRNAQIISDLAPSLDEARIARNDVTERLLNPGRLSESACASDKARLVAHGAALDSFIAWTEAQGRACNVISRNGPSKACVTSAASRPGFELPRLDDPTRCGPRCTEGVDSTFSSDNYGYCQRCTWRPRPEAQGRQGVQDDFFRSECRFMRRGTKVLVRASGDVLTLLNSSEGSVATNFELAGQSGRQSFSCGSGDCRHRSDNHDGTIPFSLSQYMSVDKLSDMSTIAAWLHHGECYKQISYVSRKHCKYVNVKFDICDVSNPKGCDSPTAP